MARTLESLAGNTAVDRHALALDLVLSMEETFREGVGTSSIDS